ncbi:hypothetical protein PsorP6_004714 [Peronosclerospora sorghi]|uniref:Uncharacterized protein n=1 Tax=Peronosclerospora sorghi TaxID=230839 RepID=A0ACC0VJ14_9STRA|nr:hypothetical protein PsorP6_004714 [Peronosclerospora sorghi]
MNDEDEDDYSVDFEDDFDEEKKKDDKEPTFDSTTDSLTLKNTQPPVVHSDNAKSNDYDELLLKPLTR